MHLMILFSTVRSITLHKVKLTGDKGRTPISSLDPWGSREKKGKLIKTPELISLFFRVLAHSGSHLRLTSLRPVHHPYFESTSTLVGFRSSCNKGIHEYFFCSILSGPFKPNTAASPTWTTLTCCFLGIAQVLAARLLSFIHVNALGNHTEGLLNLMAQTITKKISWAF